MVVKRASLDAVSRYKLLCFLSNILACGLGLLFLGTLTFLGLLGILGGFIIVLILGYLLFRYKRKYFEHSGIDFHIELRVLPFSYGLGLIALVIGGFWRSIIPIVSIEVITLIPLVLGLMILLPLVYILVFLKGFDFKPK
ncbi:MAG: hypothetical protein ACFFBD_28970 [Candidatus Hodarchaeota archaeon]